MSRNATEATVEDLTARDKRPPMILVPTTVTASRPMLLGYVRATALRNAAELSRVTSELEAFAAREDFTLGRVFVDMGPAAGAFHALVDELARNESIRGVLIPDHRHLSADEQVTLSRHEHGSGTPVLAVDPRAFPLPPS